MYFDGYPRPQLERSNWLNLNGEWNFTVNNSPRIPKEYGDTIIVPFSPESKLSGVDRQIMPGEYLFYEKEIILPECFNNSRVILNIGASDFETTVFANGEKVISHTGGYLPFDADISDFIADGKVDIVIRVKDDTDTSYHSRGKQKTKRGGIWYTPQSGIWQTVWLEPVPKDYIKSLRITPDYDAGTVSVSAATEGQEKAYAIFDNIRYELPAVIPVKDFEAWTPDNPKLYYFSATCGDDEVKSYFAMRKISVAKDENGIPRLMLNNEVCFHNGLLDQGYWQDGLYTPPSEDAMIADIKMAKDMGFNVLRKHIKVEPLRWYYHCDRMGMMVWQDMINGGGKYNPVTIILPLFLGYNWSDNHYGLFARKSKDGREEFKKELIEMINLLYNCPCIVLWTVFNEGWGQFDAEQMYRIVKDADNTRLIDHASGWHDQGIGEIVSKHVYFRKYKFKPDRKGRCVLLSEFGGYNHKVYGHCFNDKNFGYKGYETPQQLKFAMKELYENEILPAKKSGLSGVIYTQLSDVEDELNGLITYDRKVVKIPPDEVKNIISI